MYHTDQDLGFHLMFLSGPSMAWPWLVGTTITLSMSNYEFAKPKLTAPASLAHFPTAH